MTSTKGPRGTAYPPVVVKRLHESRVLAVTEEWLASRGFDGIVTKATRFEDVGVNFSDPGLGVTEAASYCRLLSRIFDVPCTARDARKWNTVADVCEFVYRAMPARQ